MKEDRSSLNKPNPFFPFCPLSYEWPAARRPDLQSSTPVNLLGRKRPRKQPRNWRGKKAHKTEGCRHIYAQKSIATGRGKRHPGWKTGGWEISMYVGREAKAHKRNTGNRWKRVQEGTPRETLRGDKSDLHRQKWTKMYRCAKIDFWTNRHRQRYRGNT